MAAIRGAYSETCHTLEDEAIDNAHALLRRMVERFAAEHPKAPVKPPEPLEPFVLRDGDSRLDALRAAEPA